MDCLISKPSLNKIPGMVSHSDQHLDGTHVANYPARELPHDITWLTGSNQVVQVDGEIRSYFTLYMTPASETAFAFTSDAGAKSMQGETVPDLIETLVVAPLGISFTSLPVCRRVWLGVFIATSSFDTGEKLIDSALDICKAVLECRRSYLASE